MISDEDDGSFEEDCGDGEDKRNSFDSARKKRRVVIQVHRFNEMNPFGKILKESDEAQRKLEERKLDVEEPKLALDERIRVEDSKKSRKERKEERTERAEKRDSREMMSNSKK